jgi:hypothetical protein
MSTHKPGTLSGSLVAIKGQAIATVQQEAPHHPEPQGYFKAMTLKIDRARYQRLKQMGLDADKTSQQLLIEAVDLLFRERGR